MTEQDPTASRAPRALHELPATELIQAFQRRELSPVEVTQSVLGHIERWEQHLKALYLLRPELALKQARASEARWLEGDATGAGRVAISRGRPPIPTWSAGITS